MPSYVSCHTIACMPLQQIRYLKQILGDQPGVRIKRLLGSQLGGKLLLELDAENREDLEKAMEICHVHFDWIFRVEFDES